MRRLALLLALATAGPLTAQQFWGVSSSAGAFRDHAEWFPKVAAAGVGSVRLFPEWNGFQNKDGTWNWERGDALVQTAAANKLELTAILMGSPPGSKTAHAFPMDDLPGWAKYVEAVVGRYKGRVRHWEVWNEGNAGFNDGKHTTADYAKLVAVTAAAAKKADPQAKIGLSVASFDAAYLRQTMLALKAAGHATAFDFVCVHPYEIADGLAGPHGEIAYLGMVKILRDVLAEAAPERKDADIWVSEIGRRVEKQKGHEVTEAEAARDLVKLYAMAAAQGIARVQWFEARDPVGEDAGFGLLRRDGSPRPAYAALQRLAAALGPKPTFSGMWQMGQSGPTCGLVFDGKAGPILVAWLPAGGKHDAAPRYLFKTDATVTNVVTGEVTALERGRPFVPTKSPVLVTGLPADAMEAIKPIAGKYLNWHGDYSAAKTVGIDFNPHTIRTAPAAPGGLYRAGPADQPVVTFADGTAGILLPGDIGHPINFFAHPSFAPIQTKEYHVRVTVRRVADGNVGMNLLYERADSQGKAAYVNAEKWFGTTKDTGWQTYTWHVKDAAFAKMWGHDFTIRPEQSIPFVLGKVEVSTDPFPQGRTP